MQLDCCRAVTSKGDQCDCEEFSPSDDQPFVCGECSHGRSKHPKLQSNNNGGPSDKQTVLKLFQSVTDRKASLEQAKAETLEGFKKKNAPLPKSSRKGKNIKKVSSQMSL
jgi:hypothetical protein